MFQFETEEMQPRIAPKATSGLAMSEAVSKPTVPEVSILLDKIKPVTAGVVESTQLGITQHTYSSWGKTVQPKIIYPANRDDIAAIGSDRRNPYVINSKEMSSNVGNGKPQQSLEELQTNPSRTNCMEVEVLTTSTSTQTDSNILSFGDTIDGNKQLPKNLPRNQDYKELLVIVKDMRMEQQRLMLICSELLKHHIRSAENIKHITFKDTGTQYEEYLQGLLKPFQASLPSALNRKIPLPQLAQPAGPTAQSTKYHSATSCTAIDQPVEQRQKQHLSLDFYKPVSEQSLVMNELALKYLPDDTLNKLVYDMRLSPILSQKMNEKETAYRQGRTIRNALNNIENSDKGPSDFSNTSYRYVKKYRLLSQDQKINLTPTRQYHHDRPIITRPSTSNDMLNFSATIEQPKFL